MAYTWVDPNYLLTRMILQVGILFQQIGCSPPGNDHISQQTGKPENHRLKSAKDAKGAIPLNALRSKIRAACITIIVLPKTLLLKMKKNMSVCPGICDRFLGGYVCLTCLIKLHQRLRWYQLLVLPTYFADGISCYFTDCEVFEARLKLEGIIIYDKIIVQNSALKVIRELVS